MIYTSRTAENTLKRYLSAFPVIGLTGPRQSGKSTLLQNIVPDYTYITFDESENLIAFEEDPLGFIDQFEGRVIFDEVQFVPEIFNIIKVKVDNDRLNYGKYILTGSSQFSFLQKASESLAGRIGLMCLLPFEFSEIPQSLQKQSIYSGAYPELVLRNYFESRLWYSSYLDTYLTKDVRPIAKIDNMSDFRKLIRLLAAQTSQILDMSNLARTIGISVPTVKRWVNILEVSYIIFRVEPYYENLGKRISKRPKLYFYDTGLVSHLTGIRSYEQYNNGPLAGALFENYIISEIIKHHKHQATHADFYYLRTQNQAEIDLIVDQDAEKTYIEIKKSGTYTPKMSTALRSLANPNDQKIILYNGKNSSDRGVDILFYQDYFQKCAR